MSFTKEYLLQRAYAANKPSDWMLVGDDSCVVHFHPDSGGFFRVYTEYDLLSFQDGFLEVCTVGELKEYINKVEGIETNMAKLYCFMEKLYKQILSAASTELENPEKEYIVWTEQAAKEGVELQAGMQCELEHGTSVIVDYLGNDVALVTAVSGVFKEGSVDKRMLVPVPSQTPLEIQRDEVLEFMDNNCHMKQVELILAMQQAGLFKEV